jgi:hypothetical protein
MERAMERQKRGNACVVPVVLRPTDNWHSAPFGKIQALPDEGKAITLWLDQDEAFANVAQGMRKLVEGLQAKPLPQSFTNLHGPVYTLFKPRVWTTHAKIIWSVLGILMLLTAFALQYYYFGSPASIRSLHSSTTEKTPSSSPPISIATPTNIATPASPTPSDVSFVTLGFPIPSNQVEVQAQQFYTQYIQTKPSLHFQLSNMPAVTSASTGDCPNSTSGDSVEAQWRNQFAICVMSDSRTNLSNNFALQAHLTILSGEGAGLVIGYNSGHNYFNFAFNGNDDGYSSAGTAYLNFGQTPTWYCLGPGADMNGYTSNACNIPFPSVRTGSQQTNVLTAIVHQDDVYAYINGIPLIAVSHTFVPPDFNYSAPSGQIGISAKSGKTSGTTVVCSEMEIWNF